MEDALSNAYPNLARHLRRHSIACLPTPVSEHIFQTPVGERRVWVKHDDLSSPIYGGNKIRKLEYLLQRAKDRNASRIATFGTVGSNHALATAIHARRAGFECTCFLAHQARTPGVPKVLDAHLELGTEIVKWGGRENRLESYRRYIQGRKTWVIPLGGSCWLGAVGFVNAGLELVQQIESGAIERPHRIYIANGTMGSVAGLAIGLALAHLHIEIHAVRVAANRLSQPKTLENLKRKTAALLRRYDCSIPSDVAEQTTIVWRDEFLAGGYAAVDSVTQDAVAVARHSLGLELDTTYTGKAMAAMLNDLRDSGERARFLFWNTYNGARLPESNDHSDRRKLPHQFARYFVD